MACYSQHVRKSFRGKSIVAQGHHFNAEKQIEWALKNLVEEAVAEIDEKFPSCPETVDGVEYTYRLTRYMGIDSKITYYGLNENDLPWIDEWPWPTLADLPAANLKIARRRTAALLALLQTTARSCRSRIFSVSQRTSPDFVNSCSNKYLLNEYLLNPRASSFSKKAHSSWLCRVITSSAVLALRSKHNLKLHYVFVARFSCVRKISENTFVPLRRLIFSASC